MPSSRFRTGSVIGMLVLLAAFAVALSPALPSGLTAANGTLCGITFGFFGCPKPAHNECGGNDDEKRRWEGLRCELPLRGFCHEGRCVACAQRNERVNASTGQRCCDGVPPLDGKCIALGFANKPQEEDSSSSSSSSSACSTKADCNDQKACTDDDCAGGICFHYNITDRNCCKDGTPKRDYSLCEDGAGSCMDGLCVVGSSSSSARGR